MTRTPACSSVVAALLFVCACGGQVIEPPPNPPTEPEPPDCPGGEALFDALDAWVAQELAANEVPGAALAVLCEDRLAWSQGWGEIRTGWGQPITPETRFQLASVTKMFTAATTLSLVEDGVVDLNTPLDAYVPYAAVEAPWGVPVDLHTLLSHTAGYPTWFPGGDFSSYVLADYFANNAGQPLWSPPGVLFNYSNLGVALAGLALEEAADRPFADLVEEHVFEPAGMVGARLDAAAVESEGDYAWGHTGLVSAPSVLGPTSAYFPTGYYGPMGGAWASVVDLATWGEVLLSDGGGVLSPESAASLRTPKTETRTSPGQHYGYGMFIDRLGEQERWMHGGSVMGFRANWVVVPEAGVGVFALINCDWYSAASITAHTLDALLGTEQLDLTDYLASSDDWPDYVGTYRDPVTLGTFEVREEGDSLISAFLDEGIESELTGTFEDSVSFWYEPLNQTVRGTFWREDEEGPAGWLVTPHGVAERVE